MMADTVSAGYLVFEDRVVVGEEAANGKPCHEHCAQ